MESLDQLAGQGEVLSQSEVERLLAQVAEQEGSTVVHKQSGERDSTKADSIQPYDFRQPAFLSAGELRKLRLTHEGFIRELAGRLSNYLRLEFGLQMSKLQTLTYQKFMESLPNPTHITMFKVEPLRGICLLDVPPRLGLTIVDRLLGGHGHSVVVDRDLSDIESALLDQAIHIILSEWCNHWSNHQELRPNLLGHENNSRFVQTAAHDTVMMTLSMEARLGDCLEQMQLGIPYYTLEPLVMRMNTEMNSKERATEPVDQKNLRWNRTLDDVKVPVVAEWDGMEISARDVASLKIGDVLEISPQMVQQVQIRLAKMPKFVGQLGQRGNAWAVELTQCLKS